uniref:Uncharacterized protein n=1 Tax=Daphnia magna TaxID=35525 RepID=A0A0P4YKU5_9CRUS
MDWLNRKDISEEGRNESLPGVGEGTRSGIRRISMCLLYVSHQWVKMKTSLLFCSILRVVQAQLDPASKF